MATLRDFLVEIALAALILNVAFVECFASSGWRPFGGKLYKIFDEEKTWEEARKACLAEGANLLSVHSVNEANFIYYLMDFPMLPRNDASLLESFEGVMWIGIHGCSKKANKWCWSDSTPYKELEHFHWKKPRKHKKAEGCGVMFLTIPTGYDTPFGWYPIHCDVKVKHYICKK